MLKNLSSPDGAREIEEPRVKSAFVPESVLASAPQVLAELARGGREIV